MKYILIMSLSGSTMVVSCLLLRYLLKNQMAVRMQYLLARIAVLYYLVPLPFVKKWYVNIAEHLLQKQKKVSKISTVWARYVVHANERIYISTYLKVQIVVISLWVLISLLILLIELVDYLRTRSRITNYICGIDAEESGFVEKLKRKCGLKRKVIVYQGNAGTGTMTFGFFKPVILCGQKIGDPEAELILCHELVHIKRWDTLWKVLRQMVIFLHWWNPMAWILYCDFERVCEWSCDEVVVEGKTKEEVKLYLRLLIRESTKTADNEDPRLRWEAGFGNGAEKIRKRMENVMKMKKWNRVVAGIAVLVLVLANSVTTLAYEDTVHYGKEETMSDEEIDSMLQKSAWQFLSEETTVKEIKNDISEWCPEDAGIRYDQQFVNMDGEIYEIQDGISVYGYANCDHDYESGRAEQHVKQSGGGCILRVYSAQRCEKCGYVLLGDKRYEIIYTECPH